MLFSILVLSRVQDHTFCVDGMIITGEDAIFLQRVRILLRQQFETKNLGLPCYFVATKVSRGLPVRLGSVVKELGWEMGGLFSGPGYGLCSKKEKSFPWTCGCLLSQQIYDRCTCCIY